jgi:superfamily II DNA or RNA helicase
MSSVKIIDKYTIEFSKGEWNKNDRMMAACVDVEIDEKTRKAKCDIRVTGKRALMDFMKEVFPYITNHSEMATYRKSLYAGIKTMYDNVFNEFMGTHYQKLGYNRDLYKHQKETLCASVNRRVNLWALSMGLGKTISAASLSKITGARRTIIICPSLVKFNWLEDMTKFWGYNMIYWSVLDAVKSKCIYAFDERFVVLNYEMVGKHMSYLLKDRIDHIIIDECFPYWTPILTEEGWMPIGFVVENRLDLSVLSCDLSTNELTLQKILWHNVKERKIDYIRIKHEQGELVCTKNHKVFIEGRGFIPAEEISVANGDKMRLLRREIYDPEKGKEYSKILLPEMCQFISKTESGLEEEISSSCSVQDRTINHRDFLPNLRIKFQSPTELTEDIEGSTFLQYELLSEMEDVSTRDTRSGTQSRSGRKSSTDYDRNSSKESSDSQSFIRTHESSKSNAHAWSQREDDCIEQREDVSFQGREWAINEATIGIASSDRISNGTCNHNDSSETSIPEPAESLQSGFGSHREHDCYRGGRQDTHNEEVEVLGQEEDGSFEFVRVESLEILERGSGREFANVRGEDKVYNIQVETNSNYFANGLLVSNCHYLKNQHSGRATNVRKLIEAAGKPRITMLTGTPVTNRIDDMFNYLRMADHPLGQNFAKFKERYTKTNGTRGKITGAQNLLELKSRVSNLMIRLRSEDCLDLPPMVMKNCYFEFDDLSKEYEEELRKLRDKKERYNLLEGAEKQKMSHEIKANIHTLNRIVSTSKVPKIKELVDNLIEQGEKVIVFCDYKDPLHKLETMFGDTCVKINGTVPSHKRLDLINRFKEDDSCKVFLANTQAGGIGINLVNARYVIFMNYSFTPDRPEQAQKRAHRPGQTRTVFVYYAICKGTIDEHIHELLHGKAEDINALIDEDNAKGLINYKNIPSMLFKKLLE